MTCRMLWAKYLCLSGSYAPEHQVCLLCKFVTLGRCAHRGTVHSELQEIQRRCMRPPLHVQMLDSLQPAHSGELYPRHTCILRAFCMCRSATGPNRKVLGGTSSQI